MIEIKHKFTGNVLFACDADNLKDAVIKAVECGADLGGAYLRGADLGGADLGGAYLGGADLRGAYLRGAYLGGAYLRGAYLGGADLRGAYLRGEKLAICPLSITGLYWDVLITESFMEIGCQRHEHAEWKAFDDEAISNMAVKASEFWKQNKTWLLAACKAHRAESLAYRKAHPAIEEKEAA